MFVATKFNTVWSVYNEVCVFQKAQISFAQRAQAILILFEKPTCANYFQIEREKSYDYLYKLHSTLVQLPS